MFGKDSKAGRGVGKPDSGKKGRLPGGSGWSVLACEAGGSPIKAGTLWDCLGSIFDFLWLVLSWKDGAREGEGIGNH